MLSADALGRRMLQPSITRTVHPYIMSLPYVAVSFVNMVDLPYAATKSAWCAFLIGEPGFMSVSADGKSVSIRDAQLSQSTPIDILKLNLESGVVLPVALMMISLESRSRYRINGWVNTKTSRVLGRISFELKVEIAFGNCPKVRHKNML